MRKGDDICERDTNWATQLHLFSRNIGPIQPKEICLMAESSCISKQLTIKKDVGNLTLLILDEGVKRSLRLIAQTPINQKKWPFSDAHMDCSWGFTCTVTNNSGQSSLIKKFLTEMKSKWSLPKRKHVTLNQAKICSRVRKVSVVCDVCLCCLSFKEVPSSRMAASDGPWRNSYTAQRSLRGRVLPCTSQWPHSLQRPQQSQSWRCSQGFIKFSICASGTCFLARIQSFPCSL